MKHMPTVLSHVQLTTDSRVWCAVTIAYNIRSVEVLALSHDHTQCP